MLVASAMMAFSALASAVSIVSTLGDDDGLTRAENLQLDPDAVSIGDAIALDFSRFVLDAERAGLTVPEPGLLGLVALGLLATCAARRGRRAR